MSIALALFPLAVAAQPLFDDPAVRGQPFKTDIPVIPEQFIGEWASRISSCRTDTVKRSNIVIERKQVAGVPVKAVWAYSDFSAVHLNLDDREKTGDIRYLDISHDGMALKVRVSGRGKEVLLVRCPTRLATGTAAKSARKHMALACRNRDMDAFLDGFFASPSALAEEISIIRGDAPAKLWASQYYRLPPIKFAPHAAYYEYGPEHAVLLKFETVSLADGGFRIEWEQDPLVRDDRVFEYSPEYGFAEGLRGRLSFKWVAGCWKLASDEIRWTDWP